jgi:hypothetical protein
MRSRWRKGLVVLVLSLSSLSLHAQKGGQGSDPPPSGGCSCQAGGATCLFGTIDGCSISCTKKSCECTGAWCFAGWPMPARCACK